MNSLRQRVLTNWHLMRVLRLGLGVWILVMAIQTRDWTIGAFSGFFIYTALVGAGCCGSQDCYVPNTPERNTVETGTGTSNEKKMMN